MPQMRNPNDDFGDAFDCWDLPVFTRVCNFRNNNKKEFCPIQFAS
jgi:hypothetical protein